MFNFRKKGPTRLPDKFKRFWSVATASVLTLLLGVGGILSVGASDKSLHVINPATQKLDSQYSWGYRFIPGVTTVTHGGFTNEWQNLGWNGSLSDPSQRKPSPFTSSGWVTSHNNGEVLYIPLDTTPGQAWVRYNNVGVWNGQIVDLKFTIWESDRKMGQDMINAGSRPTLAVKTNDIAFALTKYNCRDMWMEATFLKHGTNEKMPNDFKYHLTFHDMDGMPALKTPGWDGSTQSHAEYCRFADNYFDTAYVSTANNGHIQRRTGIDYKGSTVSTYWNVTDVETADSSPEGEATIMASGPTLMFSYNDTTYGPGYGSRSWYQFKLDALAVAPFLSLIHI